MNRMNEIRSTYENSLPNKAGGRGRRDWCTTERIKKGERNYYALEAISFRPNPARLHPNKYKHGTRIVK
jgi:hypothetical protein